MNFVRVRVFEYREEIDILNKMELQEETTREGKRYHMKMMGEKRERDQD